MKRLVFLLLALAEATPVVSAKEYHVSPDGRDSGPGTAAKPFETISAAADVARPGDTITVGGGVYRERVNPPRRGTRFQPITYRAAKGQKVVIKGSETLKRWKHLEDGVWKVTLHDRFFGDHHPFKTEIRGDWFSGKGRFHHTGQVYLNGQALFEKAKIEHVRNPQRYEDALEQYETRLEKAPSLYTWYCETEQDTTTIWANFHDYHPNEQQVEVTTRETCFYPDEPGRDFIIVRGFHMSQAATPWSAPTAEQVGLLGTHWSKGWIIEENVIRNSRCVGITLGKGRKTGHNVYIKDPETGGAVHYNRVIDRALKQGWSRETIGSHVVRNNTISDCGAAGICGSMGAVFSEVSGNHIYDIHTHRQFSGAEMAGIKLHGAVDTVIRNNRIHHSGSYGLWLDWMTQGTLVRRNLFYRNADNDVFLEVNHGPYLLANNMMLSKRALDSWSHGGAYAHNLIGGEVMVRRARRKTPYLKEHATEVLGRQPIFGGDERYYNNLFMKANALQAYDKKEIKFPIFTGGNVSLTSSNAAGGSDRIKALDTEAKLKLTDRGDTVELHITLSGMIDRQINTDMVTTALLGKTKIGGLPYVERDDTSIRIFRDYFGFKRNEDNPIPGPFEIQADGRHVLQVWPPR